LHEISASVVEGKPDKDYQHNFEHQYEKLNLFDDRHHCKL